ncbi:MAG: preprotein translocase subunit SecE [Methylobacter sp.]|nr:MAG: preprotein translocase subunit SecE [Methylobacter sp.]PPD17923.1 MAG: preprotein translocase subunit SecE [Methylobacter sp.]
MNSPAETAVTPVFDIVKQVVSGLLLIAGVAGFYFFSEVSLLFRVLGLVLLVSIVFGIMLTTEAGKGFWVFLLDSRQEVAKVVWPTRDETVRTTLLVFGMVFIVGFFLWLLDLGLFWVVRTLTGQEG